MLATVTTATASPRGSVVPRLLAVGRQMKCSFQTTTTELYVAGVFL